MLTPLAIGVTLVIFALIVYFLWFKNPPTNSNTILSGSQQGVVKTKLPYDLQPSFNQPEGLVYSYAMWILVKDFSYGYGEQRTILNKGDSPGIYLDSTSNSIVVKIKTYGTTESVLIPNIPAAKWIHLAVVVDQHAADIYINGTLRQHHTLSQLPDLSDEKVQIGSGWNGVVGNVSYYARALSYGEVRKMSRESPPPDLEPKIGVPDYFDITWYTGRLNSS